jgi:transposase
MANNKNVSVIHSILTLYSKGWKKARIARELGIDVKTVRRYIRQAEDAEQESESADSKSPNPPTGSEVSKSLNPPTGSSGPDSKCKAYRDAIQKKVDSGLHAQRIFQDLVSEEGFEGGYDSVKRFVRKLKEADPERIYRMECLPGEEAQVDFGEGFYLETSEGKRRKAHILRVVLSCSRKGYTEAVTSQSAENFIRCLENAFRAFGGVPRTLCIDNLRAAVKKADWYEPELTPKIESFCRHYDTVVLPCRVRTPEHKGKVENSIQYVKENALKARRFPCVAEINSHLRSWEEKVADTRIHGTTCQQVRKRFEELEKPALQPLPPDLFPCFEEGPRTVHRDSYVEVKSAYYQVPAEYIGEQVWVRWDTRMVRVFNRHQQQIAVLPRKEPGQFSECLGSRGRSVGMERDKAFWLRRCARMGDNCGLWALEVIADRGDPGIRLLQGLHQMKNKHSIRELDRACELALTHGAYRLSDLRRLIVRPTRQESLPFMDKHPLIRDMREYTDFLETLYPEAETMEAR